MSFKYSGIYYHYVEILISMDTDNRGKSRFKITIVGDSNVGKKSLYKQIAERPAFSQWDINGTLEILQRNANFNPANFSDQRTLYIFVFLYDLSRLNSLIYALEMYNKIQMEMGSNFVMSFAGNKCDLIQVAKILQTKSMVEGMIKEKNLKNFDHAYISVKKRIKVYQLIADFCNFKRRCQRQKNIWYMIMKKNSKGIEEQNYSRMKQVLKQNDDLKLVLAEKDRIIENQARHIKKSQQRIDEITQLNMDLQRIMKKIISKSKLFNHKSAKYSDRSSDLKQKRKLKIKRRLQQGSCLSDNLQSIHEVITQSLESEVKDLSNLQAGIIVEDKMKSQGKQS